MKKSAIQIMPEYFEKYIRQVDDVELDDAFQKNLSALSAIDVAKLKSLDKKVYAEGKWTIKDILQHVIDTERVLTYRTLRFARRDGVIPQGYDQELFASNANAEQRSLENILEELSQLHQSTRLMFRSFSSRRLAILPLFPR